jgi:hypothetical protein
MTTQYIKYPLSGGIATYANLAAFPPVAADGAAGIALDTDSLYIFNLATNTWKLSGGPSSVLTIGSPANGLAINSGVLTIGLASAVAAGALSSTDWSAFNGKQNALSFGNLSEATSSVLTITGGTGVLVGSSGCSIEVKQANASQSGYLSATDWAAFSGKQAALTPGGISETTSSVLTISNGSNSTVGPNVTLQVKQASLTQGGYLSMADWITFSLKEEVLTFSSPLSRFGNVVSLLDVPYTPAGAGYWASPLPTTLKAAIDRIAAVVGASTPIA